jgi:hypothetical protein
VINDGSTCSCVLQDNRISDASTVGTGKILDCMPAKAQDYTHLVLQIIAEKLLVLNLGAQYFASA